MASNQTKELWRSRIERLLATDMGVTEWCHANKVSDSTMFKWIGFFADTEPELFGGAQNIADRDRNAWPVKTRENMRGLSAPIVPAGQGFVRVDVASLAARAEPGLAPAITVSGNS